MPTNAMYALAHRFGQIWEAPAGGGVAFGKHTAVPTADAANRGVPMRTEGGTGVADTQIVVHKNVADAYSNANIALSSYVPGYIGVVPYQYLARIDASRNLVDDGTDQAIFPTTGDAITLIAGGTYYFDALYSFTKGANNVSTFLLFGGTATLTTIRYFVQGVTAATATTAVAMLSQNSAVATEVEFAAAGTGVHVRGLLTGCLEVNAAGTFIPQMNFSAATGSTPAVNVDTFFRIYQVGQNPITAIGPWA